MPVPATHSPQAPLSPPQSFLFPDPLSLNLRVTEESDALQLFQLRDSIFYALLNYLRHEPGTSEAAGWPARVESVYHKASRSTLSD